MRPPFTTADRLRAGTSSCTSRASTPITGWLADFCKAAPARLWGIGYSDPEFDPFWTLTIDLGLSVQMHLGARNTRGDPKLYSADMVMSKLAMAEPIAMMVFDGLFLRHPQLKFVTVESGVGWFAFVAAYMDKLWNKHRHWTKSPLKEPPSHYMDRQVYGTFLEDTVGMLLRNQAGARNIMWSSDYPHSETSWPDSRAAAIERSLAGFSAEDRYRVICGTAKELYDGTAKELYNGTAKELYNVS